MGINENDLANEFEFDGNTFIEGMFQLIDKIRSAQGDEIVIESYYITEKNTGRKFIGIERIRNAQGDLAIPAELRSGGGGDEHWGRGVLVVQESDEFNHTGHRDENRFGLAM